MLCYLVFYPFLTNFIAQHSFTGVPNAQLVKEKADIAIAYKNKSVAEQVSPGRQYLVLEMPGDLLIYFN